MRSSNFIFLGVCSLSLTQISQLLARELERQNRANYNYQSMSNALAHDLEICLTFESFVRWLMGRERALNSTQWNLTHDWQSTLKTGEKKTHLEIIFNKLRESENETFFSSFITAHFFFTMCTIRLDTRRATGADKIRKICEKKESENLIFCVWKCQKWLSWPTETVCGLVDDRRDSTLCCCTSSSCSR